MNYILDDIQIAIIERVRTRLNDGKTMSYDVRRALAAQLDYVLSDMIDYEDDES